MTAQNSSSSSATPPRASKQPLAFIEDLPENLRPFYKDIASVLKSPLALSKKGVRFEVSGSKESAEFCSPFRVTRLVQEPNQNNWSRVIELINFKRELVECVIPNGTLDGKPRDAITMLSNRGLLIFNDQAIRTILQLIRNWPVPEDNYNILTEKVGWTSDFDAFITPSGRVIARNKAALRYSLVGKMDGKEVGDLGAWRAGVAALAVGNTNLIFAIALGLSTALLPFTDLATVIFHLCGLTTKGKTRVLRVGLTVWPKIGEALKTWSTTVNGLEGEIAQSNHILLGLDDLPKDAPEELGNMIYKISLGSGKGRSEKDGSAKKRSSWHTAVLSTGEQSMMDALKKLGKTPTGGQGVRMIDIPVEGTYGAFDDLHGHATSDAFVRALNKATSDASGPVGAAFVEVLIKAPPEKLKGLLAIRLEEQAAALQAHLGIIAGDQKTAEIRRVIDSFALIAVAGELSTEFGLTGWTKGMASDAIKTIAQRWLGNRGPMALDKKESIKLISDYLIENELRFVLIDEARPVLPGEDWPIGYQDEQYFYVLSTTMPKIFVEKNKMPIFLNHLLNEDYLCKGNEKNSMQFKMSPIGKSRPRAYRVRRSILDFNGSINNASETTGENSKDQEKRND